MIAAEIPTVNAQPSFPAYFAYRPPFGIGNGAVGEVGEALLPEVGVEMPGN
jgi:hypothetical protein